MFISRLNWHMRTSYPTCKFAGGADSRGQIRNEVARFTAKGLAMASAVSATNGSAMKHLTVEVPVHLKTIEAKVVILGAQGKIMIT